MLSIRYARGVVLFIALAFGAAPAWALDPLLLELSWRQPEPVTLPGDYHVTVGGGGYGGSWIERVTAFPHNSFADEATVNLLGFAMTAAPKITNTTSFPQINMTNGGDHTQGTGQSPDQPVGGYFPRLVSYRDTSADWRTITEAAGWDVDLRVPLPTDFGMFGYTITDMERIVTAERQTVRFYGVVPEPTTCLLVVLCAVHVSTLSRRGLRAAIPARPLFHAPKSNSR